MLYSAKTVPHIIEAVVCYVLTMPNCTLSNYLRGKQLNHQELALLLHFMQLIIKVPEQ